jgi:hypothetical protein
MLTPIVRPEGEIQPSSVTPAMALTRTDHPVDYFLAILPLEYRKEVARNTQRYRAQRAMINPESYPHVNHQTLTT